MVQEIVPEALRRLRELPAEVISRTVRTVPMGFGRPLAVNADQTVADIERLAATDIFALNGLDVSGKGCLIGLAVDRTDLSESGLMLFHRLASHLASAYRCRRRLKELERKPLDDWEALIDPEKGLVDVRGPAEPRPEREALQRATRAIEGVRHQGAREEPTVAWLPRVRGRWTLIDTFTEAGHRYVVARENQAQAQGLEALTERERQVVASIATGKTGKEAAYDLGISHGTVRVLLARARLRLGVSSNRELLELPAIKALRGQN